MAAVFQRALIPLSERSPDETLYLQRWLFDLQVFDAFSFEQTSFLADSIKTIQLENCQTVFVEGGFQFCYMCFGQVSINIGETNKKNSRNKIKNQTIRAQSWISGKSFSAKSCSLRGLQQKNRAIVILSNDARKTINKKQRQHLNKIITIIQRQPLFEPIDKDTILEIASDSKIKTYTRNGCLYDKYDKADCSYVLIEGHIIIMSEGVQVSMLSPEQVFGDEDILTGKTIRNFKAVVVSEKVKVIKIQKSKIIQALNVLTVLGKNKLLQNYLLSKNNYRQSITNNVAKRRNSFDVPSPKKISLMQNLPLFRPSLLPRERVQVPEQEQDNQQKILLSPIRVAVERKSSFGTIIRSRNSSICLHGDVLRQQKSKSLLKLPQIKR